MHKVHPHMQHTHSQHQVYFSFHYLVNNREECSKSGGGDGRWQGWWWRWPKKKQATNAKPTDECVATAYRGLVGLRRLGTITHFSLWLHLQSSPHYHLHRVIIIIIMLSLLLLSFSNSYFHLLNTIKALWWHTKAKDIAPTPIIIASQFGLHVCVHACIHAHVRACVMRESVCLRGLRKAPLKVFTDANWKDSSVSFIPKYWRRW